MNVHVATDEDLFIELKSIIRPRHRRSYWMQNAAPKICTARLSSLESNPYTGEASLHSRTRTHKARQKML